MTAEEDWQHLLAAERRLQGLVPGAILVGGTAVALHLHHRLSLDGDHVVADLRDRFDDVLTKLEASPSWETERLRRPVLILGRLDRALTGLRQQRRVRALETETRDGLCVPTLAELARIKSWLLVERDTVRDYVDVVAIFEALGEEGVRRALADFDATYERGPSAARPSVELIERLRAGRPADRDTVDLTSYKGILPPWSDWEFVEARGHQWSTHLARWTLSS